MKVINESVDLNEPKCNLPKYHPDAPFSDPLVRCNNCGTMDLTEKYTKRGHCLKCGNRRCRNIINLTEDEYNQALAWGVDSEFLELFEAVADE